MTTWKSSQPPVLMLMVHIVSVLTAMMIRSGDGKCEFEAIFNFGDSNSDTGGYWAAFPAQRGPFGMTYFKAPTGRASDGRLIVDFFAEALGVPFLSPYLQSIGSDYRHGVNFATLASTVLLPNTSLFVTGISPFSLAIQLNQMREFKVKVDEFLSGKKQGSTILPTNPAIFGKSLYLLYIGQNDFTSNLGAIEQGGGGVGKHLLLQVVAQIVSTVKELYELGARVFLVFNLAPVGCYPAFLAARLRNTSELDAFGCLVSYNNAAMEYNDVLKEAIDISREALKDASSLVYVDIHAALLHLFQNPASHGLKYGIRACCGHGGGAYNFDPQIYCGNQKVVDGKVVSASACMDPYNYVSWDGIHATEAANKLLAAAFLNGSYLDPPFAFQC